VRAPPPPRRPAGPRSTTHVRAPLLNPKSPNRPAASSAASATSVSTARTKQPAAVRVPREPRREPGACRRGRPAPRGNPGKPGRPGNPGMPTGPRRDGGASLPRSRPSNGSNGSSVGTASTGARSGARGGRPAGADGGLAAGDARRGRRGRRERRRGRAARAASGVPPAVTWARAAERAGAAGSPRRAPHASHAGPVQPAPGRVVGAERAHRRLVAGVTLAERGLGGTAVGAAKDDAHAVLARLTPTLGRRLRHPAASSSAARGRARAPRLGHVQAVHLRQRARHPARHRGHAHVGPNTSRGSRRDRATVVRIGCAPTRGTPPSAPRRGRARARGA
jgi:hypothetical protein